MDRESITKISSFVHFKDQPVQPNELQQRNPKLLALHVPHGVASLLVLLNVNKQCFTFGDCCSDFTNPYQVTKPTHAQANVEICFKEAKTAGQCRLVEI